MGWNYERGEGEALHSFGHRVEGILSLTLGKGVWDQKKNPDNVWTRFTRIDKDLPGSSQVGNVHFPPNGRKDYDYDRKDSVESAADDWLHYPRVAGVRRKTNCNTWGGPDFQLNYLKWWLRRLPQSHGTLDGFYANWWEYVLNYDEAVRILPPPGGRLRVANRMMR